MKKKWILAAIMASSLFVNHTAVLAAEGEEESIDNKYAFNTIEINKDTATVNGVTASHDGEYSRTVSANHAGNANIAYNILRFNDGKVYLTINGGDYSGSIKGNELTFNGGVFSLKMYDTNNYNGDITNNTFSINGGVFSNAYNNMPLVNASGNNFNISGTPDITDAYIYGGFFGKAGTSSDNTLNFRATGLTAKNIYDFDNLNFYLPSYTSAGSTALTLTDGSTDISNSAITAVVAGGTDLTTGDKVNLLYNSNGLNTSGVTFDSRFAEGVTVTYDSDISSTNNALILTIGEPQVEEQTRALAQGVLSTEGVVSRGTERILDWLPPEEFDDVMSEENSEEQAAAMVAAINNSFGMFTNMDGSKLRSKTGSGSYIDSKSRGIDLGFARAVENQAGGTLIFAPLFDYGKSDYDSYLANGTHGSGTSKYFAGGLIGRKMLKNGFYYEGSFRGGKAKTNFSSDDFMMGPHHVTVGYDASAPVFAGHVRVGKLLRMNRDNLLHVYGIYAHNHVNSMDTNLSTGEHYNFDAVDSGKFRLGYRLTTRVSKISRLYTGLAYQYEFNGSTSGNYRSYVTPEANLKGSSGMLELGWQIKPSSKNHWMVDMNCTGWAGLQKGITVTAKMKKSF